MLNPDAGPTNGGGGGGAGSPSRSSSGGCGSGGQSKHGGQAKSHLHQAAAGAIGRRRAHTLDTRSDDQIQLSTELYD